MVKRHEPRTVTDPAAWRALAHPLRMRLLDELMDVPSARATDLAEAVDQPVNSVSFHLRQLARYGYVERDEHDGDRREKWWRATSRNGFRISGGPDTEAKAEAGRELVQVIRAHTHATVDEWLAAIGDTDPDVDVESMNHDVRLHLTDVEFAQFRQEMGALWDRWMSTSRAHDKDRSGLVTLRDVGFGWTDRSVATE